MLAPQSVDPSDAIMVFDGMDVITEQGYNDGPTSHYQQTLGDTLEYTDMKVDVVFMDMTDNTIHTKTNIPMTYYRSTMFWSILIADLNTDDSSLPMLVTGHKFTGVIRQSASDTNTPNPVMRTFTVLEFVVDDRGLEKTLMTQGYELDFTVVPSKFIWRDDQGAITYEADAYTGGTGTNTATSPADVTHRGPITKA